MFDLIGFWFVVSIITVSMFTPIGFILYPIVGHMVEKITGEESLSRKVKDKIYNEKAPGDDVYLFSKYKIHVGFLLLLFAGGILSWLCCVVSITSERSESVVELISWFGTQTDSFMGYVGVFVLVYSGTIFFGKQIWKLKVKVDEIIEKTSD